jgi:hypothetical protein
LLLLSRLLLLLDLLQLRLVMWRQLPGLYAAGRHGGHHPG